MAASPLYSQPCQTSHGCRKRRVLALPSAQKRLTEKPGTGSPDTVRLHVSTEHEFLVIARATHFLDADRKSPGRTAHSQPPCWTPCVQPWLVMALSAKTNLVARVLPGTHWPVTDADRH